MKQRINRLVTTMPADFEAALVTTAVNRFYFLGLDTSDAGTLLILPEQSYFIIDSRYIETAQREVKTAQVVLEDKAVEQLSALVKAHGVKKLYMESNETLAYAEKVRCALPADTVLDTGSTLSSAIDALRMIKSESELSSIRRAQKITDDCFTYVLNYLKPGMREIDVALEMELFMRKHGAGKLAFDTILVAGTKTSLPHGTPSENVLQTGDFVTMDFGANVDGYCTDMTRTVALGSVTDEQKRVYDTVLKAQLAACAGAKANMRGCDVDKIARDIILDAGYGGCFGHGLGHSLGIEIHEDPRYSPMCTDEIKEGTMMTIEPGVYLAGKFGVRIEDTVVVRKNDVEILGTSDKNLIIL